MNDHSYYFRVVLIDIILNQILRITIPTMPDDISKSLARPILSPVIIPTPMPIPTKKTATLLAIIHFSLSEKLVCVFFKLQSLILRWRLALHLLLGKAVPVMAVSFVHCE